MKQLKNPWLIVPLILLGSILTALYPEMKAHQLKNWMDLLAALPDATFHAFCTVTGWLLFRSPWAGTFRELTLDTSAQTPAGEVKTQTKATLQTSDPPPAGPKVTPLGR